MLRLIFYSLMSWASTPAPDGMGWDAVVGWDGVGWDRVGIKVAILQLEGMGFHSCP